jgi:hypothetical protein
MLSHLAFSLLSVSYWCSQQHPSVRLRGLTYKVRVFNCVPCREKCPTVAVTANPTRPYWVSFNDWMFPSCCLLQHLSLLSTWKDKSMRSTPLKLVHFAQDLGMQWWPLGTMENNIDCTKSHRSSNRSILYTWKKESGLGSDVSSAIVGLVQCQQKMTEAQIFKNLCRQCTKWANQQ